MATRAAAGESGAALISAKCRVPPLADRLIERPRLAGLITEMVVGHRPLFVSASAGSGKTTAVAQALRGSELPVAWLTVDSTDAARAGC